ncbi:MAG: hypothetical protein F6J96_19015 [Symploca sp. SIO1C2]|nr:hypothetical protein [Symploca sp. SIO1C2]
MRIISEAKGGRWQVVGGRWQVVGGRWQEVGGRWQEELGELGELRKKRELIIFGYKAQEIPPKISFTRQEAGGRRQEAGG